jgi:nucleotide-binding universal stress UspA family protein
VRRHRDVLTVGGVGVVAHPKVEGVAVGDDGSAGSREAVRWAAREAALRGSALYVLRAWSILDLAPAAAQASVPALADLEGRVRAGMAADWAELGGDGSVHLQPVHGPAVRALLDASDTADLVVVGSRGRGGFTELVLGSTADQVIRHARCPVAVVRPQDPPP